MGAHLAEVVHIVDVGGLEVVQSAVGVARHRDVEEAALGGRPTINRGGPKSEAGSKVMCEAGCKR